LNGGQDRQRDNAQRKQAAEMTEDECKRLHQAYQLELSELIETCVKAGCPTIFPGFQYELIYGERGWGARDAGGDDLRLGPRGFAQSYFREIELTVRSLFDAALCSISLDRANDSQPRGIQSQLF